MKEKYKTKTHYIVNIKLGEKEWEYCRQGVREYDSAEIVQEENVQGRKAIQISLFPPERWRTPEDTVKILKEVAGLIETLFYEDKNR